MHILTLSILEFAAAVHATMSLVLFYFSRRSVSFLAQAWIMMLISFMISSGFIYLCINPLPPLGMLHPVLLIYLLACSFLLSIHPLGLSLPGYLQMGRMWGYASPALALIIIYVFGFLLGSNPVKVYDAEDIKLYLLSGDVLLRIAALLLSAYYIINIFLLPHRLVRRFSLPRATKAYGAALGLVSVLFFFLTIRFNISAFIIYLVVFTAVNMLLFFHILSPVYHSLPKPAIRQVVEPPTPEEISHSEKSDFNEANLRRFEVMEYIMQHDRPWTEPTFNRDRLCRLAGLNRHLVLQSLRSQGYNDTHEYIYRYRIEELKRLVLNGTITSLHQCEQLGFRSPTTAAANFERLENRSLNDWFEENKKSEAPEPSAAADDFTHKKDDSTDEK